MYFEKEDRRRFPRELLPRDEAQRIAAAAATERSYHGGSFRGGCGHGLAADIVSVSGDPDGQRWMASDKLWNWIDVHWEFGIGRPYLGKDPAHVGPIDGYANHRKSNVAKRLLAKVSNTLPNFRTVTSGGTTAAELKSTSARYLSLSLHETEAVGALSLSRCVAGLLAALR